MSSAIADEFSAWWTARHPSAWPVGWSLRLRAPRHWMQVHSLPNNQRQPASDDDWTELLMRHRDISTTTLGDGTECWLVIGAADDAKSPVSWPTKFAMEPPEPIMLTPLHDSDTRMRFAVARIEWDFERFAPLVRAFANNDDRGSLLVVNLDPGQIYAPYPGGADLFFGMFCEHDDALRRFARWQSMRSESM